ncbi:hypothetical protein XELAEV_18047535mg [Xenopus laevis]|uniref:Uncharacterized protein n=1 Tax=Xenopus laevis TaxID=8355 RepID=A0A974BVB4_XENLA|nr:hypothetical protein XELAEV_18047535mg [Xenopus laevis]
MLEFNIKKRFRVFQSRPKRQLQKTNRRKCICISYVNKPDQCFRSGAIIIGMTAEQIFWHKSCIYNIVDEQLKCARLLT